MALSRDEVLHVALLCRIALSDAEVEELQGQLSDILGQFEALAELDTSEAAPTAHSVPLTTVTRRDDARPASPKEEVLANAPRREGDYFRVLPVLEES